MAIINYIEKQEKNGHPDGCRCMMCGRHGHAKHWIIKLLILIIVFWVGFKLGELKMLVREAVYGPMFYGHGGMMWRGSEADLGGYGAMRRMMNGWGWYGSATSTKK